MADHIPIEYRKNSDGSVTYLVRDAYPRGPIWIITVRRAPDSHSARFLFNDAKKLPLEFARLDLDELHADIERWLQDFGYDLRLTRVTPI